MEYEYEQEEENRKEIRKSNIANKKSHQNFLDEETRLFNKSNKNRKYRLQELEQEELEEEWEEYLN